MTATSRIRLSANVKAVRRARELSRVSRQELGLRLGISHKAIEKIENGRTDLSEKRLLEILEALNLKMSDLTGIKKGRGLLKGKPKKKVISNELRRSYKKLITKECQVLKSMRKQKNISQDNASAICGYARAAIGHIENGRIELSVKRQLLLHTNDSYKFPSKRSIN